MEKKLKILTTFWFLAGLTLLLLNDFVFKELYGNWLTGKLSDFAGIFIFPLFWTALFPKHKNVVFLLTALFFIYWKSHFSQSLIDNWNLFGLFTISRVVDYTDLIALAVLPLAYIIDIQKDKLKKLRINPVIPLLCAAFSFMATSYHTNIPINKTYELNFSKDTLQARLTQIDSLKYGYGNLLTKANPETVKITIPYDLCSDSFEAKVEINEVSNNRTLMTLIEVFHSCPKNENDKKEAIDAFDRLIIEKINNAP